MRALDGGNVTNVATIVSAAKLTSLESILYVALS